MKKQFNLFLIVILCVTILLPIFTGTAVNADESFTINIRLYAEVENFPSVEIDVTGLRESTSVFYFASSQGGIFGAFDEIASLFLDVDVVTSTGESLDWSWNDKEFVIDNPEQKDFTISYIIDADKIARGGGSGVNGAFAGERFVLFTNSEIFFSPAETLMMPRTEPTALTLSTFPPEDVEIYSSLPQTDGMFVAVRDLWGSLTADFARLYFFGGKLKFYEEFEGRTGNRYRFVLFDTVIEPRDYDSWFPSYDDLGDAALAYMDVTDMFFKYFSDNIAPLPAHDVIITDTVSRGQTQRVSDRGNWFDRMQLWPQDAMLAQVAHHVFHNYSFNGWSAKLAFNMDSFLYEGLPTYYEHIAPAQVLDDDYFLGRLYAPFVIDSRGQLFEIRNNQFHTRYNVSVFKVYLLDKAIRTVSNGEKCINDFVRMLYDETDNAESPTSLNEEQIVSLYGQLVGAENIGAYETIRDMTVFESSDFQPLLDSFTAYADAVADEYFWKSRLVFLCYLDIATAKGDEWPHFALAEQQMPFSRIDMLRKFRDYLFSLNKSSYTEQDITDGLEYATGKNHSGFFEFWRDKGVNLDPNDIPKVDTWNTGRVYTPNEHTVPHMALLLLDNPDASQISQVIASSDTSATPDSDTESVIKYGWIWAILFIFVMGGAGLIVKGRRK